MILNYALLQEKMHIFVVLDITMVSMTSSLVIANEY